MSSWPITSKVSEHYDSSVARLGETGTCKPTAAANPNILRKYLDLQYATVARHTNAVAKILIYFHRSGENRFDIGGSADGSQGH
ncbi:hypothetical protein SNOG_12193 [Parastagonospora nodorum SN15]|uniref:Uncharacterized protein n=1 Tax=Phaeosphaeria nodorum (strain SN15 / ATCC MYA-4574 / FGSC 10173) TaxID=321614 RepID=Q0U7S1_PHANO|nr:hypothetical protein SNOG_12193 [Parastagonospora nodorum SN15]EAT80605.1 hypothetical protein SNOG_12193 [Parastagonospora nodorum SN15]